MNMDEFKDENNIVDPNVRRIQGTQENSRPIPNQQRERRRDAQSTTKKVVTPAQLGFTNPEKEVIERPEQPILDNMEKAIARKQREAQLLADAIDESDGEGITEDEFQDILVQAKDEINDDFIPVEDENDNVTQPQSRNESFLSNVSTENPASSLMNDLDAELAMDDADYASMHGSDDEYYDDEEPAEEVEEAPSKKVVPMTTVHDESDENNEKPKTTKTLNREDIVVNDDPFKDFQGGDIDFNKEEEDLEDNVDRTEEEKEQQEQMDKLRSLVREKIRPVSSGFDISTFSISKKPASKTISTPRDNGNKIADWVLMSSQKPIYMRRFTGTEIERLANGGKGRTRLNKVLDMWKLIYDHIVDPHKPEKLEDWAKSTSFLDIDHIYMAIYRANFEGSNFIPFNCTNKDCKEKVFLTDNIDIMDMCKFNKKSDKEKFFSILGSETNASSKLYSTEVVPVSDDYAFAFREPSIYNIIFESAVLDEDFVDKFGDLVTICTYIDGIYYINKAERTLQPVRSNIYPNNMKKTVKSRIINYSKIISTLNSDQYNTILAYMQKINESGDSLSYQTPEVTCPYCGTVIPARDQEAQSLVFTRHQLAALANI